MQRACGSSGLEITIEDKRSLSILIFFKSTPQQEQQKDFHFGVMYAARIFRIFLECRSDDMITRATFITHLLLSGIAWRNVGCDVSCTAGLQLLKSCIQNGNSLPAVGTHLYFQRSIA